MQTQLLPVQYHSAHAVNSVKASSKTHNFRMQIAENDYCIAPTVSGLHKTNPCLGGQHLRARKKL